MKFAQDTPPIRHPSERVSQTQLHIARQIDLRDRHHPNSDDEGDVFGGPKIAVLVRLKAETLN
jgi:hypothetical protein